MPRCVIHPRRGRSAHCRLIWSLFAVPFPTVAAAHKRHYGTSDDATGGLPFGLSFALILAEPALGAHPERHVFPPGVRVAGDVPVAARGAEVAAGHREPLGGIEFVLADDRPLGADITVGRAIVLRAEAEAASGADPAALRDRRPVSTGAVP